MERVNKRIGVLGEPVIIGTIVGVLLGLLTRQDITTIIPMGMGVAGVMVLMPRVVGVLMDGLSPIGKAAKDFMTKQMGEDADLNIGMDVALGLGDPTTTTTTVISIPLVMLCALALPGVKTFPIGILMSVIYMSDDGYGKQRKFVALNTNNCSFLCNCHVLRWLCSTRCNRDVKWCWSWSERARNRLCVNRSMEYPYLLAFNYF